MKKPLLLGVLASLSLAVPAVAHAGGPPVVNFTDTNHVVLNDLPFVGACAVGTVSIDARETFHVTDLGDHFVVKFNQAGTFAFDPSDPAAPESSGRYHNGDTTVGTANTFSTTTNFVVHGENEDGEPTAFRIHAAFVVANGEVRVDDVDIECG